MAYEEDDEEDGEEVGDGLLEVVGWFEELSDFFCADELVIGGTYERHVRDFGSFFLQPECFEVTREKGQVIRAWEYVIVGEPEGPKRTGRPTVASVAILGIFSGDIEVDDTDTSSGFEDSFGVFDGTEPVGDHGQGV